MAAIDPLIRPVLAAIALVLATCSTASAQARVRWVEPPCVPAWWDRAGLAAALRVELRGAGVVESSDSEGALEIGATPRDCAPDQSAVTVRVGTSVREIDLADTAGEARARTIALTIASLLADAEADAEAVAVADADAEPEADADAEPEADAEQDAPANDVDLDRSDALGDPSRAPPRPPPAPVSLALSFEGVWSPASAAGLGGARVTLAIRPARELPLAITGALRGVGGSAAHALGEVRAAWLDAWLGAALELELAPVRFGLALALGVGATHQQGVTTRADVIVRDHAHPTVAVELAVALEVEIARPLSLTLGLGGQAAIVGLEARAGPEPVLGIRDLLPVARLGARVAL